MKNFVKIFLILFSLSAINLPSLLQAKNLPEAQYYFLMEADTKEVLASRNADARIPPSSMTKVMTAFVVFDQIKKGKVKLESQCLIGKDAWRKSGSTMFLNYGDVITIDELLKGLLAVSGNDAAIALAETVGGGVDKFVALMNQKAQEIGLKNSNFKNPHGLAENNHFMSVRDLAILTAKFLEEYPQYADYLGIEEFSYHNIRQYNRNPLIKKKYDGIIGGKTGHTDAGGYGVLAVAKRADRALIAVVNKVSTPKKRAEYITALMDYGFENYNKITMFSENQKVVKASVWLGAKDEITAMTKEKIAFTIPADKNLSDIEVSVVLKSPIFAPIKKGENIAKLNVKVRGFKKFEYDLIASENITKGSYFSSIKQIIYYKISNLFNN
jgi:D-alanyl-D-alanine carboxypeptidase (penicillin-binding protein 5/6)